MDTIIQEVDQIKQASSEPLESLNIIPELKARGYAMLPGLSFWFDILSPFENRDAWEALHHPTVTAHIHAHPAQLQMHFIDDFGKLDKVSHRSVEFTAKPEKTYLTVVEGADSISQCPLLPAAVQSYLTHCFEFITRMREYLSHLFPSTLPTILKLRIFDYHASDHLIEMRSLNGPRYAMRPHVDGSVCTTVIAQSDGLFLLQHEGRWRVATRIGDEPFAVLIPGVAAAHNFDIAPTPHVVLPGIDRRASVTIFLTPALLGSREDAERQLSRWNLRLQ